ncbi:attractin-like protein 1 [Neolamprologus brichardi]|uniref:attractin-like protein 1 n=1 Tax=Neolamprologus brichardi TaxID=32507 RepID=UPI001643C34F|nr:attractin-like protein 1 [Neolamprologus brichardi]
MFSPLCVSFCRLTDLSGSLTDGPFNYKYKTKCTWLIEGFPNAVLRLRFNHFATECSWDHMYVYDGDSIYAPLIAVFSGLVVPETRGNETVPEVVTTSGYALLYFFSDAAYNLTGFSIAYSINSCPNNCSGHGRCSTANSVAGRVYCECEEYWKGDACDIPYCRDNCGSPDHGYCDLTGEKLCVCNDSWQGPDCSLSVPSTEAFWVLPSIKPSAQSLGRASHRALVHSGLMWVVGGYSFNYSNYQMVLNYNLETSTWDVVPVSSGPLYRYGHSLALHQDDIYMFGGKLEAGPANVTDEMWVFNVPRRTWSLRKPVPPPPYALEGHAAHVVELANGEPVMLIIFGYSPIYSYINKVQEYNIRSNSWQVVSSGGAVVQGGYGHSSVYDEASGCVFVHGGYKALNNNKYGLVDHMYRYHVHTRTWLILKESGLARYLHSAVLLSGTMLVFGGNTHNDTSLSNGAKCFSADFLAYDIACDEWTVLPRPGLHRDINRFGHSAVVSNGSMYIFGGFSGMLLNDVLAYTPPSCQAFSSPGLCAAAEPGVRCHWVKSRCVPWKPKPLDHIFPAPFCPARPGSPQSQSARPCKTPCALRTSCANCTSQAMECMWCGSTQRCVDSSAYVISFPYGQCLEWQTQDCTAQNCSGLRTCAECLERVECGWCGDPSNTGRGVCMEGSYRGPLKPVTAKAGPRDRDRLRDRDMVVDQGLCSSDRGYNWAFIQCPACQCNGHSRCVNGSVCEHCGNLTAGTHCQSCMPGYYGDPTNGGKCNACKCNSHANVCHVNTGKCFCTTKGVKGDQCQLCDSENRYLGNPLRGTCYYNLLIDYQFTFSLLQEDDRYYTAINFMATPEQNKSCDLFIRWSKKSHLFFNLFLFLAAGTISGEEMPIIARMNIKEHRDSFSSEKFNFRLHHNITFYVYVSNFSWPIKIQIAFSQHNSIMDLVQFFVTFFR